MLFENNYFYMILYFSFGKVLYLPLYDENFVKKFQDKNLGARYTKAILTAM